VNAVLCNGVKLRALARVSTKIRQAVSNIIDGEVATGRVEKIKEHAAS
jgi:hypothetical protein